MDLILDDDDATVVCLVSHQPIGGLKRDSVAIAPEPRH